MRKLSFSPLDLRKNPGFMVLALTALEKQSLNRKLDRCLPSQGILKSRSTVFTDDGIDFYSSRCMSDPNCMALALTGTGKQG